MAYCGPRGIPLSTFLAWSDEDQQAALQWHAWEARRCPSCHTHPEDWNPQMGGSRNFQHWHPHVCIGCQRKQQAQADLEGDRDTTRGLGLVAVPGSPHQCEACRPDDAQP